MKDTKEKKGRAHSGAEIGGRGGEGNIRGRQAKRRYGNIILGHST